MWRILIVLCFVCQFSAFGQTVVEGESSIILNDNSAEINLVIESLKDISSNINLELIKPDGEVCAKTSILKNLISGKQSLSFKFDLDKTEVNSVDFIWYRLRYNIENGSSSVISLSTILPDTFELRMITRPHGNDNSANFVRVWAYNPTNEIAVSNVVVNGKLQLEDGTIFTANAETNSDGLAILEFQIPNLNESDEADIVVTASKNGFKRTVKDSIGIDNFNVAYIQTDKSLYQPNQDVNLRFIYTNHLFSKPIGDQLFTLKIESKVDSEEIAFKQSIKTSRFGIASTTWKIPENVKLGMYSIEVYDAKNNVVGVEEIKVSRYEMPNFYVEAKPEKSFYLPSETTTNIEIKGNYLFDKPVTKATFRVVSVENNSEDKFSEITGDLNSDGKFITTLDISKFQEDFQKDKYDQFKDVSFNAFITDKTTNRTESRRFDIRLTKSPIHVYLVDVEKTRSRNLPAKYFVSTFYADGTPAICDVKIYRRIDKDADGKEVPTEIGDLITSTATNSFGGGKLMFLPDENNIKLKIIADDRKGSFGEAETNANFSNEKAIQIETDKAIYRKGDSVKITIRSTESNQKVFIDITKFNGLLKTLQTKLLNGKAEVTVPYNPKFINELMFAAYFGDKNSRIELDKTIIFYPTPNSLEIDAKVTKSEFRPSENVSIQLRSNSDKEIAYGVLVLDQAIEERSRTESEFGRGNESLNRKFYSRMINPLGLQKGFAGLSLRDLKNIDTSKPISDDLQLAVSITLRDAFDYKLDAQSSDSFHSEAERAFTPFFEKAFTPISEVLNKTFAEKSVFPRNDQNLQEILASKNIDFAKMRDAWDMPYQTEFKSVEDRLYIEIWSFGADKLAKTSDDLSVLQISWRYFEPFGKAIDKAMIDYKKRTENYITNYETLKNELKSSGIDLDSLRDADSNPFKFEFSVERTYFVLSVKTVDGKVKFWRNEADYFSVRRNQIVLALNRFVIENKSFPQTANEFKNVLKEVGFNLDELKDIHGRQYYVDKKSSKHSINRMNAVDGYLKSVRQVMTTYSVRGKGKDGVEGNFDDYEILSFRGASSEQEYDISKRKKITKKSYVSNIFGAIGGVVFDPNGAVIPNTLIVAKNIETLKTYQVTSIDNGDYLLQNLPKGIYELKFDGRYGFKTLIIMNVLIEPNTLYEIDVEMEVGAVTATVDVSSGESDVINTSSSSISNTVTKTDLTAKEKLSFTPNIRQYFPETLVWSPEIISDKNGNATVDFKFADTITNWKFYAIASTEDGEFGLVEKDLKTFQPFFVDLDPPKFLTAGDEIYLPIQVRNYTLTKQKVDVTMAKSDWFSFLESEPRAIATGLTVQDGQTQKIEVDKNAASNAIFGFKAIMPIKNGKQRVTAIAPEDSDAIEKPVTVRPNGEEIVRTESKLFANSAQFEVNFPENMQPKTSKAELKIYPNLMSHVTESVEGLLQRPYGCGEQTISSTYPNLMILKFGETETKGHGGTEKIAASPRQPISASIIKQAKKNLKSGYERLLGYQIADGGFSYWGGKDSSDIALTAYALRFLNDAKSKIEVDEKVIENATNYLIKQQREDGSFTKKYYYETTEDLPRTKLFTSYVARTLAMIGRNVTPTSSGTLPDGRVSALEKALNYLKSNYSELEEPYTLALYALASFDAGNIIEAEKTVERLQSLAKVEGETVYWNLETNTPFYGWGTAGRIETSALVLQALLKHEGGRMKDENKNLISKATMFLLKNKDRYGVWYSTQTTINVLDAFLASLSESKNQTISVKINGEKLQDFAVSVDQIEPIIIPLNEKLTNINRLDITSSENSAIMSQIVKTHYIDWKDSVSVNRNVNDSRAIRLDYKCDKLNAKIMENITCSVEAERIGFKGYGMLLAEIGIPPGANVSRESLEEAFKNDWSLSRYDILPDRIVVYMWAKAGGSKFNFSFNPRYGINAQTPASIVYDYYNEESRGVVSPLKFVVK
jgi:A-macroglobulin TED domain/Alpha-2-macroglobulin family/MG2 domain/Carboxypeptidase regulatory-like domain/A-macroglobulin receptor binding domain/Alpha-2-macroglobulin bait region domain/Macroglobulin domain MG3